ncbi:MAG: Type 1 glutamine amidotransferase-like domain-containing protein [Lagierella massiliensis]|nr:Type 1 glutamine amidotransferase-like domain-containing protein [Lagierella massiliensis]
MIIAIGGGEVRKNETYAIDKFIVEQSEKEKPTLLFIPTASRDNPFYVDTIKRLYGDLGCEVDTLFLCSEDMTVETAKGKIENADIIYVGGGDTEFMMNKWREFQVDKFLIEAYKKDKVLSGLSAGSICWFIAGFDYEVSDAEKSLKYPKIQGLGIVPYLNCPHYDKVEPEKFDKYYLKENTSLIALENQTALVWDKGQLYVINSNPNKNVYELSIVDRALKKRILE